MTVIASLLVHLEVRYSHHGQQDTPVAQAVVVYETTNEMPSSYHKFGNADITNNVECKIHPPTGAVAEKSEHKPNKQRAVQHLYLGPTLVLEECLFLLGHCQ
jgi:hypothetical protein